jgi:hypothetical protein
MSFRRRLLQNKRYSFCRLKVARVILVIAFSSAGVFAQNLTFPTEWKSFEVKNVRVGEASLNLKYQREVGEITLTVERA